MEFFFNEKSLGSFDSLEKAKEMIVHFIKTCSLLRSRGFKVMRCINNGDTLINNQVLFQNYHVYDWKKDASVDEVTRNVLRDILSRCLVSPLYAKDDKTKTDISGFYFQLNKVDKEFIEENSGLSLASYCNSIAVSFKTNAIWDSPYVPMIQHVISNNETFDEYSHDVRHASSEIHLDEHQEWINSLVKNGGLTKWKPSVLYFPALEFSNRLVANEDWDQFYNDNKALSTEERISKLEETAKRVATRNGYSKNPNLSKKNDRTVYSAGIYKSRIFLALDTSHGTFEVCGSNGHHLGEYTFGGKQISDPESTHGIKL